jgi:PKHD-type hydroxylase
MDQALGRNFDTHTRKLSVVVALNDGFEGGQFQINTNGEHNPETIPLPKGRLVVFPSYILHRVTPVTKGVRHSLVVWVVGPKFR